MMRKSSLVLVLLLALPLLPARPAAAGPAWPALAQQLSRDHVQPGSALERLIEANQEFRMLRPEEAHDTIPVPLWLRVLYRKAHPEATFSAADPTGGYPLVLKEVHEWMTTHQNLRVPRLPQLTTGETKAASSGGDLRISGAQTSARSESDVRINFLNPNQIIAASNAISSSGRQAQFWSTDGGATWSQTSLPLTSRDQYHSDPAVDWTTDGRAWAVTLGVQGLTLRARAYVSNDGGATWTFDGSPSDTQKNVDKELMWVDHSATSAFKNNIYVIWHNGNPAYVGRRTAAGWQLPIQVSSTESTGTAIGGDIKTNSAGDVFAFWPATGNRRIVVAKSTNGGASFPTRVVVATTFDSYDIGVPAMNSRRALIYVSGGAYKNATTDNVYAAWTDLTGASGCNTASNEPASNTASSCKSRIWFSRSTNGGSTWSAPVMINNQASLNDQFNQGLAVDETSGKIGIVYYDTVNDPGRKKTDLFYQSSADGGVTWSAPLKVTSAQTDETVAGADSGNQYGDYNSMSAYLTKFFPSWTDRRNNAKEEIWTAPVIDP